MPTTDLGAVDIHAHCVPPRVLHVLERHADTYGVRVQASARGCCLHFAYGLTLRPLFPRLLDLDERLRMMEMQGIERQILSVWTDLHGYGLEPSTGARWHRLLNEALTEITQRYPERFAALVSVPLQDAARAATELAYGVRQCGAVGGIIATNIEGRNLDDPALDELWSAAVELQVPLFLHPVQPMPTSRTERYYLNAIAYYIYDSTVTVGALLFSGVLDRFPTLQLILPHGGGFYTYQVGRFDIAYTNVEQLRQRIAHPPSAYLRRFYYDTVVHHPTALQFLSTLVGCDRLLLGSDYPFPMATAEPLQLLSRAGLDPADIAAITAGNARMVFRL